MKHDLIRPGGVARGRRNNRMQRIDSGYVYELGETISRVRHFRLGEFQAYEIWGPLQAVQAKVNEFISNSVFASSLRGLYPSASVFLQAVNALSQRITNEQMQTVNAVALMPLAAAYDRFEPVLASELTTAVTYLVQPKGAYDVTVLIDNGAQLFPSDVAIKAPEATRDIQEGAKALAFELWSGAAFHFHRANEAVLRRYYDHCVGLYQRPDPCTMGTMLRNMEQRSAGDEQVIAALRNITKFHRNPNSHPGQFVDDAEQAFSLVAAIRAVMGYMLAELSMIPFDELMSSTPNPNVNAAPLISAPSADAAAQ